MKIGIIGDLHFGVNENEFYFKYQQDSLIHYFSELTKEKLDLIVFLGDIFDKRNYITIKTFHFVQKIFIKLIKEFFYSIPIIIITGNHDVLNKNTNKLNTLELVFKDLEQFHLVIDDVFVWNNDLVFVPWVNKENREKLIKQLKNYIPNKYLFGHLDVANFMITKNYQSTTNSLPVSLLDNFDLVISGHYHIGSQKNNIIFLGSAFQINWLDEGDLKHIAILDTEIDKLSFITNKYEVFKRIVITCEKDIDFERIQDLQNKIVKIVLRTKRTIKFEDFVSKLEKVVESLEIIDENLILNDIEQEKVDIDNVDDIIIDYLTNQFPEKAEKLKELFFELKKELGEN